MIVVRKYVTSKGFTLIELLVVIAIIGLLSSIVLASLNTARAKARDAVRLSSLRNIQQALELYASDHDGKYPATTNWFSQCSAWGSYANNAVIPGLVPTYMPSLPVDPSTNNAIVDCIIYWSNGTDFKLLDYNILDSPNPGAVPALVDPERNYGQPYARPPGCTGTGSNEVTPTWAIYTPGIMCL